MIMDYVRHAIYHDLHLKCLTPNCLLLLLWNHPQKPTVFKLPTRKDDIQEWEHVLYAIIIVKRHALLPESAPYNVHSAFSIMSKLQKPAHSSKITYWHDIAHLLRAVVPNAIMVPAAGKLNWTTYTLKTCYEPNRTCRDVAFCVLRCIVTVGTLKL